MQLRLWVGPADADVAAVQDGDERRAGTVPDGGRAAAAREVQVNPARPGRFQPQVAGRVGSQPGT